MAAGHTGLALHVTVRLGTAGLRVLPLRVCATVAKHSPPLRQDPIRFWTSSRPSAGMLAWRGLRARYVLYMHARCVPSLCLAHRTVLTTRARRGETQGGKPSPRLRMSLRTCPGRRSALLAVCGACSGGTFS